MKNATTDAAMHIVMMTTKATQTPLKPFFFSTLSFSNRSVSASKNSSLSFLAVSGKVSLVIGSVGQDVGAVVGTGVGASVGGGVGAAVGASVGEEVGVSVGAAVGTAEGGASVHPESVVYILPK